MRYARSKSFHPTELPSRSLIIGSLLFLSICTTACGGTIRHDVPDADYLALAAQPEFAAVGQLVFSIPSATSYASGTLIDPFWVLTAGHVVSFPTPTSGTFKLGNVTYTAVEWFSHPD